MLSLGLVCGIGLPGWATLLLLLHREVGPLLAVCMGLYADAPGLSLSQHLAKESFFLFLFPLKISLLYYRA